MASNSKKSLDIVELTAHAKKLENFQTQSLKRLLNCPRHVPPAIVRLFAGVEPLTARLDMLKLRFFWRLSKTNKTPISKIANEFKESDFLVLVEDFTIKFLTSAVSITRLIPGTAYALERETRCYG